MKLNSRSSKTTKAAARTAEPVRGIKPAVAAKPAESPREIKPATAPKPVTTIEAKIDVGFGNNLYLRGEGGGLSWERGTPLKCVDPQTWQWTGEVSDTMKFKVLLNDTVWAQGEDLVASPGRRVEVFPAF